MLFDDMFDDNLYIKNINNYKENNINLYDSNTGLIKGNMFKDEYKPYKNYVPNKLSASNKKYEVLLKLYEADFALNDISLYLDLHPEDNYLYKQFQNYVKMYKEYKTIYENNFGPLDKVCDEYSEYVWINNPWPWDKGGIQDV